MPEEKRKNTYRGFTEAQERAHKKYMENFVEIKVRMTPEKRGDIRSHATRTEESVTAFINRAIDETMKRDLKKISR